MKPKASPPHRPSRDDDVDGPREDDRADAGAEYNHHLTQLFARSKLSGPDLQRQAELSTNAGAHGVEKYIKIHGHGRKSSKSIHLKHVFTKLFAFDYKHCLNLILPFEFSERQSW